MRHKITDGDLLLLQLSNTMSDKMENQIRDAVLKWLKSKGLNNVQAYCVPSPGDEIRAIVLSVSDVVEDALLKD